MKKKEKLFDVKTIVGLSFTALFALVVLFTSSAKAENSFWGGIQDRVASLIFGKVEHSLPDLSEMPDGIFGAMSSPDISSEYLCVNGVCKWYVTQGFYSASTTLCSFDYPGDDANTILESMSWDITKATTTSASVVMATSTSMYATSTTNNLIAATEVGNSASTSVAAWIPSEWADGKFVKSTDYIIVKTEGAGLGGYTMKGTCKAVFRDY